MAIDILGQAWIHDNALVQDKVTIEDDGNVIESVITHIPNIWIDLGGSGTYKAIKLNDPSHAETTVTYVDDPTQDDVKYYLYWEYDQTSMDPKDEGKLIKVKIDCPRPNEEMSRELENIKDNSDWAKFWLMKYKLSYKNYEKNGTLAPKVVYLPKCETFSSKGVGSAAQPGSQIVDETVEREIALENNFGNLFGILSMFD